VKLWLDDQIDDPNTPMRHPPAGWFGVKTPKQAIKLLKAGGVSEIELDHDLGNNVLGDGATVLKYIQKRVVWDKSFIPPKMFVHSANPGEADMMRKMIKSIERIIAERC